MCAFSTRAFTLLGLLLVWGLLDRQRNNLIMAPADMAGVIGQDGLPINSSFSQVSRTYSEVSENRPKSNQAIIIELLNNREISNEKYIDALLEIVKVEEITHISRISRNRLCVYLTSASKATQLVEENKFLKVENEEVKINYRVAKSIKVIISNADASITNTAIKRFLTNVCGIRTASSVSELKINNNMGKLNNVFTFRRVVYIHPEDVSKLPGSRQFRGDGLTCNVFFSTGNPKCFICSSEEHLAKECSIGLSQDDKEGSLQNTTNSDNDDKHKQKQEESAQFTQTLNTREKNSTLDSQLPGDDSSNRKIQDLTAVSTPSDAASATQLAGATNQLMFAGQPLFSKPSGTSQELKKRTHPPSSLASSSPDVTNSTEDFQDEKTNSSKKMRKEIDKSARETIGKQIKLSALLIPPETAATFPVTFNQLIDIVNSSIDNGYATVANELKQGTDNVDSFIIMIQEVWSRCTDRSTKTRLTRIKKALIGGAEGDSSLEADAPT